ncbi:MAG: hypothetical protein V2A54_09450 [Bacteroidota bacterium]
MKLRLLVYSSIILIFILVELVEYYLNIGSGKGKVIVGSAIVFVIVVFEIYKREIKLINIGHEFISLSKPLKVEITLYGEEIQKFKINRNPEVICITFFLKKGSKYLIKDISQTECLRLIKFAERHKIEIEQNENEC